MPLKYQHAIYELVQSRMASLGVMVVGEPVSVPESAFRPTPTRDRHQPEHASNVWEIVNRYDAAETGNAAWILQSELSDALDEAERLIRNACSKAREARKVGFLTLARGANISDNDLGTVAKRFKMRITRVPENDAVIMGRTTVMFIGELPLS
jgi:hypothetical protein